MCGAKEKKTKRKIALFKKEKNERSQQMEWRRVS
jgi:hypothetical protein